MSNPVVVTWASLKTGQATTRTPTVETIIPAIKAKLNFLFRKNTERKLIKTGLVATATAPTPAVTDCIAIMYVPR